MVDAVAIFRLEVLKCTKKLDTLFNNETSESL